MKIRHLILALATGLSLANCAEDVEQLAKPYLERAEQSFANNQYALAKLQIDSIKQLYPKAFNTRTQAQALLIEVELTEARASKLYTDSMLTVSQDKVATLAKAFYFDKDERYQDMGTYYASRHRTEKNVGKSYLRPQTDERGVFTITAFYRGRPIGAHTLRFAAPDGSYIDLTCTTEPYIMSDVTGRTERTDFTGTPDVSHFVASNPTLTVTLIGQDRKAQMPFTKTDAKALTQVADLASALKASSELLSAQEELTRRIMFYEQRKK